MPLKLILVTSQRSYRQKLKERLEACVDITVTADMETIEEASSAQVRTQGEVILIDSDGQKHSLLESVNRLQYENPDLKIGFITSSTSQKSVIQALEAGIEGYLLKEMTTGEIANALKSMADGGIYIHPHVTHHFLREYRRLTELEEDSRFFQPAIQPPNHLLSDREIEVLELLAQGLTNNQLAERLNVSGATAKKHVSNILNKIDVDDRTQAAVTALKNGWVKAV